MVIRHRFHPLSKISQHQRRQRDHHGQKAFLNHPSFCDDLLTKLMEKIKSLWLYKIDFNDAMKFYNFDRSIKVRWSTTIKQYLLQSFSKYKRQTKAISLFFFKYTCKTLIDNWLNSFSKSNHRSKVQSGTVNFKNFYSQWICKVET